jgi:LysR family transcriptional activator of nhaA
VQHLAYGHRLGGARRTGVQRDAAAARRHEARGLRLGACTHIRFPEDLRSTPIVLPGAGSGLREAFDTLMEQAGIRPLIAAEVDDMAMLRLIARESPGVALVPPVVVRDELERGTLVERARVPGLRETFYAVTASRRFANPLVKSLLQPTGDAAVR